MGAGNWSAQDQTLRLSWVTPRLLLYPKNRVLCGLGYSEFDDGLCWNLDLLLRLWIFGLKPVRAFLFCFISLQKPGKTNSPFFLISL
jgi:hypothetical protein